MAAAEAKGFDDFITWEVNKFDELYNEDSGFADISNSFYMPETGECEWQLELIGYPKPLETTPAKGQKRLLELKMRLIRADHNQEAFRKAFSVVILCHFLNTNGDYYSAFYSRETFCTTKNTSWRSQQIDGQSLLKKLKDGILKIRLKLELIKFSVCNVPAHKVSLEIHDCLKKMLKDRTLTDIAAVDTNGNEIYVHQCVMASRCPMFNDMLRSGEFSNISEPRIYTGLDSQSMAQFIEFVYTGELSFTTCGPVVMSLLKTAMNYNMPDLKKACEDFLILNLTIPDCLNTLNFADDHGELLLKKRVLEFISTHRKHFLEEDSFLPVKNVHLLKDISVYLNQPCISKLCLS